MAIDRYGGHTGGRLGRAPLPLPNLFGEVCSEFVGFGFSIFGFLRGGLGLVLVGVCLR